MKYDLNNEERLDFDEINRLINNITPSNLDDLTELEGKAKLKYELECLLPDYVFDRISAEERAKFEREVVQFPELQTEVNDVKNLFLHLEQFDYKAMVKDKTQYLPDKVVSSLKKQNRFYEPKKPNIRRLMMIAVLCVVMVGVVFFYNKDAKMPSNYLAQNPIFTNEEKAELLADLYSSEEDYLDPEVVSIGFDDDIYSEEDYYLLLEWVEDIDEDDFQIILAELYDEL